MSADLYLKNIAIPPPAVRSMRRKARGQEVAGLVWKCPGCGWESSPCLTMAATRRKPSHDCQAGGPT